MKKVLISLLAISLIASSCSPSLYSGQVCAAYQFNKGTAVGDKAQLKFIKHNH